MTIAPPQLPQAPERYNRRWASDLKRELDQYFERARLGDIEAQSTLISLAGRRLPVAFVISASYTIKRTDDIVDVNYAGAVALTLPANPETGARAIVQDSSGAASGNNITISPDSGNINGAGSYVFSTDYGRITMIYNGTQWIAS